MNDKRTLVIDGNFMMKRILRDYSFMIDPVADRNGYLVDLSQHFAAEMERVRKFVDRVIICRDHRSWRKAMHVVQQLDAEGKEKHDVDYKANRVQSEDRNWELIYETFSEFCDNMSAKFNVPVIHCFGAEGDDCIWAVTEELRKRHIKAAVYCTDSDLNQLVTPSTVILRRIKSKTAPEGEIVLHRKFWDALNRPVSDDPFDVFNASHTKWQTDMLMLQGKSLDNGIVIINPFWVVLKQMICGSAKDNVPELFNWPAKSVTKHINPKHIEMALSLMSLTKESINESHLYDEGFLITLILNLCYVTKQNQNVKYISHYYKMLCCNRKLNYLSKKEIPQSVTDALELQIQAALEFQQPQDMSMLTKWNLIAEANGATGDKIFSKLGI